MAISADDLREPPQLATEEKYVDKYALRSHLDWRNGTILVTLWRDGCPGKMYPDIREMKLLGSAYEKSHIISV